MKERNFKFRKSYAEVIRVMDDKQAGRFIKAVSDYVFDGRAYNGNDTAIKSAFTLVKVSLDNEITDRENGRRGGIKSRELRKAKEEQPCVAKVIASGIVASEMLKSILEGRETPSDGRWGNHRKLFWQRGLLASRIRIFQTIGKSQS